MTALFILGLVMISIGVGLISFPYGIILGGFFLSAVSLLIEFGQMSAKKPPPKV